jgi:hypothetical protein
MKLIAMVVDHETEQAVLILMFSFTGKLRHWAQQNTEALYSLTCVPQFVDLVKSSFAVKDYQNENLHILVKLEHDNFDITDYARSFNDSRSFWKIYISNNCATYLFIMGLRSRSLRADLM